MATKSKQTSQELCSGRGLGGVDFRDSLLGGSLGCDGTVGFERRGVGADCAADIGRPDQKGSTERDNRMFVKGVLWIVRTGSPWRDLPEAFEHWNSVFRQDDKGRKTPAYGAQKMVSLQQQRAPSIGSAKFGTQRGRSYRDTRPRSVVTSVGWTADAAFPQVLRT